MTHHSYYIWKKRHSDSHPEHNLTISIYVLHFAYISHPFILPPRHSADGALIPHPHRRQREHRWLSSQPLLQVQSRLSHRRCSATMCPPGPWMCGRLDDGPLWSSAGCSSSQPQRRPKPRRRRRRRWCLMWSLIRSRRSRILWASRSSWVARSLVSCVSGMSFWHRCPSVIM